MSWGEVEAARDGTCRELGRHVTRRGGTCRGGVGRGGEGKGWMWCDGVLGRPRWSGAGSEGWMPLPYQTYGRDGVYHVRGYHVVSGCNTERGAGKDGGDER